MLMEMDYQRGQFPEFLRRLNEMIEDAYFIENHMSTDACFSTMGLCTDEIELIHHIDLDMGDFAEKLSLFRSVLMGSAINWKELQTTFEKDMDENIHRMAEMMTKVELSEEEMNLLAEIADGKTKASRIVEVHRNKPVSIPWMSDENNRLLARLIIDEKAKQK